MIQRWHDTPIRQRIMVAVLAITVGVGGMFIWVWNPYQQSIELIRNDVVNLNTKFEETTRNVALLQGVQDEVLALREKLSPMIQEISTVDLSQTFRRKIVTIAHKTGVFVCLWKPQENLMVGGKGETAFIIQVKVEGNFYNTARFLEELLELSWIQTIDPLVLTSRDDGDELILVTTEFTIKRTMPLPSLQPKEAQKT